MNTESNKPNPDDVSVQEAVFGHKRSRGDARAGRVPDAIKKSHDMGTIFLYENVLIPGGPGNSKKFSGPIEYDEDGIPLGLWFYPANTEQHPSVSRYWFGAEHGIIQVKKKVDK